MGAQAVSFELVGTPFLASGFHGKHTRGRSG